jgi:DNA-binding NarL/FixJ family response regulator
LIEKLPFLYQSDLKEPLHACLSDREFQVMCMLATGRTIKEIADELSLSMQTVSTYKGRILQKMNMPAVANVIRYAIENGLVP